MSNLKPLNLRFHRPRLRHSTSSCRWAQRSTAVFSSSCSMLLKMTSRQVPTSETMAAHSSGCPESARARMAAFVATDNTRFSMILRRVLLPSLMASGIFRTSLDIKVMWLVSMATAEPDMPIEIPTSAVNSAVLTGWKSTTINSPLVMVPVLSKATTLALPSVSRKSPPFTRRPDLAALVRAQKVATGVERTSAQGHALTKRTRARRSQRLTSLSFNARGRMARSAAISTRPATSAKLYQIVYFHPRLSRQ
ncbi:unnamed protein product [Spirodela intermedia]|uniref:Uncharacterized protein n=1 Tax=Spirodela intermedia TaxID=51605 RepID=A0A7I8LBM6_SPIIN|nr:unnamed protein product [Spirodela intermedia]